MSCNVLFNDRHKYHIKMIFNGLKLRMSLNGKAFTVETFLKEILNYEKNLVRSVKIMPDGNTDENSTTKAIEELKSCVKEIFNDNGTFLEKALNINPESASATFNAKFDSVLTNYTSLANKASQEAQYDEIDNYNDFTTRYIGYSNYSVLKEIKRRVSQNMLIRGLVKVGDASVDISPNQQLNRNIKIYKAELFKTVVDFMREYLSEQYPAILTVSDAMYQEDGMLDTDTYKQVKYLFMQYINSESEIAQKISTDYLRIFTGDVAASKTTQYRDIINNAINEDPQFKKWFEDTFRGVKQRAQELLYDQGRFSPYYSKIRAYISKELSRDTSEMSDAEKQTFNKHAEYLKNLNDALDNLIRPVPSLFEAMSSFTILEFFDKLLYDVLGNTIHVDESLQGFEGDFEEKYSYAIDISHHKSQTNATELDGAEQHIGKIVEVALANIPLYSREGRLIADGLTKTQILNNVSSLFAGILNGRVQLQYKVTRGAQTYRNVSNEIKRHIREMNKNPLYHLKCVFDLLCKRVSNLSYNVNAETTYLDSISDEIIDPHTKNIIRALYEGVFSSDNPDSYYSIETISKGRNRRITRSIINELCSMFNRYYHASYLYVENSEVMALEDKSRAAYYKEISDTINGYVNHMSYARRADLAAKYEFKFDWDADEKKIFSVKLNGVEGFHDGKAITFTITADKSHDNLGIFSNDNEESIKCDVDGVFDDIKKIDVYTLNYKMANSIALDPNEKFYMSILDYIQEITGLKLTNEDGLQMMNVLRNSYESSNSQGLKTVVGNLLRIGMRGSYINSLYIAMQDEGYHSLYKYLEDSKNWLWVNDKNNNRVVRNVFRQISIAAIRNVDQIYEQMGRAYLISRGAVDRQSLKDTNKNNRSKNQIECEAVKIGRMWANMSTAEELKLPSTRLWLSAGQHIEVREDLDIQNYYYSRQVKDMNERELMIHSCIDRFWMPLVIGEKFNTFATKGGTDKGIVYVQPTNYSDKVSLKLFRQRLDTRMLEAYKISSTTYADYTYNLIKDKYGAFFANIFDNITEVQRKICAEFFKDNTFGCELKQIDLTSYDLENPDDSTVAHEVARLEADRLKLYGEVSKLMQKMTVADFIDTAGKLGLEVIDEYHYRGFNGGKICGVNEQVYYDFLEYNDIDKIKARYDRIRRDFIDDQLKYRVIYEVYSSYDDIRDKIGNKTNPKKNTKIMNVIMEAFENDDTKIEKYLNKKVGKDGKEDVTSGWVDQRTGYLIYAKTIDRSGKITYITDSTKSYDHDAELIVNPLLDVFLHGESYLSNAIRLTTIGVTYAQPPYKNSPWDILKRQADVDDKSAFKATLKREMIFKNLRYTDNDVNDLINKIKGCMTLDELMQNVYTGKVQSNSLLASVGDMCMEYNRRARYDMQTKRAAALVSTKLNDLLGSKDGLSQKLKIAVIEDETAPTYNPRGGGESNHEVNDGSVVINAFTSVLEGNSRGDNKDREIKKPMYAFYDPYTGTLQFIKYAGYAITNDEMRMTLNSVKSKFNMHKKMNNIQWTKEDGIDLREYIGVDLDIISSEDANDVRKNKVINNNQKREIAFKTMILEGESLCYKRDGEVYKIHALLGDYSQDLGQILYYTKEQWAKSPSAPIKTKYHVFYDDIDPTTNRKTKSLHKIYDSFQQAVDGIKSMKERGLNPHSINSLFELHMALGGIESCDVMGVYNEKSIEAVVNMINNIGHAKDKRVKEYLATAETVVQPLKDKMIAYFANTTSFKMGARNINRSERWTDDEDVMYTEIDARGLGQQNNAEKDVEDAEISEWTQVIKACSARGYTYKMAKQLLNNISYVAFENMGDINKKINEYCNAVNINDADKIKKMKSGIYEIATRTFYEYAQSQNKESMLETLTRRLKSYVWKNMDHSKDEVYFAFDNPVILREWSHNIATMLNKAIKRKYPGMANVIAPSYNAIQYFEVTQENGEISKLLSSDIIKYAREEHREHLMDILINSTYMAETRKWIDETYEKDLKAAQKKNPNANVVKPYIGAYEYIELGSLNKTQKTYKKMNLRTMSTIGLETRVRDLYKNDPNLTTILGDYYIDSNDEVMISRHRIQVYLAKKAQYAKIYDDCSFFMPSDVVEVLDENDNPIIDTNGNIETWDLNSLEKYKEFKERYKNTTKKFRNAIFTPRNLRPSTVRAQYLDDSGVRHYINIYDLPVIYDTIGEKGYQYDSREHKKAVQDAILRLKDRGEFVLKDKKGKDKVYKIIDGTLETRPFEYVGAKRFKTDFGIDDGDSLADIMREKEDYFIKRMKKIRGTTDSSYDFALLRSRGTNVYVHVNNKVYSDAIYDDLFQSYTSDEDGYIYNTEKNGKRKMLIGRWVKTNETFKKGDVFVDKDEVERTNQNLYRLNSNGEVEERVQLLQRCTRNLKGINGATISTTYYILADEEIFKRAISTDPNKINEIRGKILDGITSSKGFDYVQLNPQLVKDPIKMAIVDVIATRLNKNPHINDRVKKYVVEQLGKIKSYDTNGEYAMSRLNLDIDNLRREFTKEIAHEKYISFLDSLKVVASRIPAQALNSFMAMECVGFTGSSENKAYVSIFQTYLQGSDFDIDKSYMMGQNYEASGRYAGWSPYFDYTSLRTLEASKLLAMPSGKRIVYSQNARVDITTQAQTLVANSDIVDGLLSTENKSEEEKLKFLGAFKDILQMLVTSDYLYKADLSENTRKIIGNTINRHMQYVIPKNIAELAAKNSVMAAVYDISSDIANMNFQYTPDSTDQFKDAAKNVKENSFDSLRDQLSPFAKLWKQRDNLASKSNVGAVANIEKFWYTYYQYWVDAAKSPLHRNLNYLKFSTKLSRIKGRSMGHIQECTIDHCPDLIINDLDTQELLGIIGISEFMREEWADVDIAIGQYISQSADNAKNPLLKLLNADLKLSSLWGAAIILGMNISDIASFMTSPVVSFISRMSDRSVYTDNMPDSSYEALNDALKKARGVLDTRNRVLRKVRTKGFNEVTASWETNEESNENIVRSLVQSKINRTDGSKAEKYKLWDALNEEARRQKFISGSEATENLTYEEFMQSLVIGAIHKGVTVAQFEEVIGTVYDNIETSRYMHELVSLYADLYELIKTDYKNDIDAYLADINDFETLNEIGGEISTATRTYISLNQGLKADYENFMKFMQNMRQIITFRERSFGIMQQALFTDYIIQDAEAEEPISQTKKNENSMAKVVERIRKISPHLTTEEIEATLTKAHLKGIMNHFDVYKALTDEEYRNVAIEYLNVIKRFVNTLDMMYSSEQCRCEMDAIKSQAVLFQTSSQAYRISMDMLKRHPYQIDTSKFGELYKAANGTVIFHYFDQLSTPIVIPQGFGDVQGFNAKFDRINGITSIDFKTAESKATFREFVENEFKSYLEMHHSDNGFVKHMTYKYEDNQIKLSTDLDTISPTDERRSELAYNEVLKGMANLHKIAFCDGYSIADILYLYNLMVNGDGFGGDTLTSLFKDVNDNKSQVWKYNAYLGSQAYNNEKLNYKYKDMLIAIAPTVSKSKSRSMNDRYIFIRDEVAGKQLYVKKFRSRGYVPQPERISLFENQSTDSDELAARNANHAHYAFRHLVFLNEDSSAARLILFDKKGVDTRELKVNLKAFIQNLMFSGNLYGILNC